METIIKNIHLVKDLINEADLQKLENGALQHRKFSRITFKVLSVTDKTIKIQAIQGKSPQENYANEETLIQRGKDLFSRFLPDQKIIVNAVTYKDNPTEKVTPEYLRHAMTEYKVKVKDIVADTGIDKTNVSAWVNGTREMSQPVRAMFYYYFLNKTKVKTSDIFVDQPRIDHIMHLKKLLDRNLKTLIETSKLVQNPNDLIFNIDGNTFWVKTDGHPDILEISGIKPILQVSDSLAIEELKTVEDWEKTTN